MQSIGKYKAILITSLITGVVVFSMFRLHMKKNRYLISETFYEVETEIEPQIQEQLEDTENQNTPSTNKAYNEDEEFKAMMRNFKAISADDFDKTTKALEKEKSEGNYKTESSDAYLKTSTNSKNYALNDNETKNYKDVQDLLNKKQDGIAEHAKNKSSLTYSLKDRRLISYNTPRYLCEQSGKIIVNISVNSEGQVVEANINNSSNSTNECLHDHALEYAKSVRFNSVSKPNQIGTITFYFKGK